MVGSWERIGFIMAGKKRLKVITRLKNGPASPRQLSLELDITLPNLSITLKELRTRKLIKDLTPKNRKGKLYGLTKSGEQALATIHELTRPQRKSRKRKARTK